MPRHARISCVLRSYKTAAVHDCIVLPGETLTDLMPVLPRAMTLTADMPGSGAAGVVLVKTGLKQVALRITDVTFVEAARNYVRIHLDGGAVLRSRVPITRLAQHFGAVRFLRVHRGRLVNVDRVRSVATLAGGHLALTLNDGSRVTVARDRRRVILAELGRTATPSGAR
jgi:DNA-binding LytR/AlgR family response regulator